MKKKAVSMLLIGAMAATMFSVSAFAEGDVDMSVLEGKTIGFAQCDNGNSWRIAETDSMEKTAKEYGIKQIRTQFEKPYLMPDASRILNRKYPINLIKVALLEFFTLINEKTVFKYGLTTNDYLLGVSFTSMMNSLAISYGLMAIKYDKVVVEALIHPCRYEDGTIDNHFEEFQITKNQKLKEKIEKLGFEITNYANNEQN